MVKKGVVLPLGVTGESDNTHTYGPAVIFKDNYFWLYYSANNGTNFRTALAFSKDGINFVKKGVVVPLGATGECDSAHVYGSTVIFKDNYFWLYYSAHDGTNIRTALALSKDGINFVKKGVVVPLGATGECDSTHTYGPAVIFKDNYFWLYYSANNGTNFRTALAFSKDGINFVKKGVVLPLGAAGESDNTHAYAPFVIFKDNYFWLYYSAHDGTNIRTALALSKDGINFVKKGVVLPLGATGESDSTYAYTPFIIFKDGYSWLYYTAYNGTNFRTALALSKDGINFV